jgi:hypothetical protein
MAAAADGDAAVREALSQRLRAYFRDTPPEAEGAEADPLQARQRSAGALLHAAA